MISELIRTDFSVIDAARYNFLVMDTVKKSEVGDTIYVSNNSYGVSLNVCGETSIITEIFLYGLNEEYQKYSGILPDGLDFNMSQKEVRLLLGKPFQIFEASASLLLGDESAMDKFKMNDYFMFVSYSDDLSSVLVVTIT